MIVYHSTPVIVSAGGSMPVTGMSLGLTNAVGGSVPWTFGYAFKQGDIPSGMYVTATSGTTAFQADARNFWPDGSVKFAVLSGISTFAANVQLVVQLGATATPPSGSNVAEPGSLTTTTVVLAAGAGSFPITGGTYNINSVLGIDRSTWTFGSGGRVRQILGPVMSEFHYYQPTSDVHLTVWWYLRVYSNGAIEVETCLENGWWLEASPSEKDYTVTVNVNGTSTFTQSNVAHFSHSRWNRVDWYSGGSPTVPAHSVSYALGTQMFPNFGWTSPSNTVLGSWAQTTSNLATVFNNVGSAFGDIVFNLDATGASPHIGLMTQWEALYFTSADKRVYQATIGNTRQWGGFNQHFRDETTGRIPIYTSYSAYTPYAGWNTAPPAVSGGSAPGENNNSNTGWNSHTPAIGYAAYLIEGRWSHLEECQWVAWLLIQEQPTPNGTLQPNNGSATTRGFAWSLRSVGNAAAISPRSWNGVTPNTADSNLTTSFVNSVSNTASYHKQHFIDGTAGSVANGIGWIGQYDQYTGAPIPATEFWGGAWMVGFQGHVLGHVADLGIEGLTNQADLYCVRNFVFQDTLQTLQTDNVRWNYRRASTYERPYLTNTTPSTPTYQSINEGALGTSFTDYQTTFSISSALSGTPGLSLKDHGSDTDTAVGSSSSMGGQGYWAIHASVAAMAKEKNAPRLLTGVASAPTKYDLMTTASNWNPTQSGTLNTYNANEVPQMSFAPRAFTQPSWYTSIAHGTWGTLPSSVVNGSSAQVANSLATWNTANQNPIAPWGGGFVNTVGIYEGATFLPGTFYCIWGGGHVDYAGNEIYAFGPLESASPKWHCPRAATSPAPNNVDVDGSGNPVASHTYQGSVYLPQQNWLMRCGIFFRSTDSNGGVETATFQFNQQSPQTNLPWTSRASMLSASDASVTAVYDPVNYCIWARAGQPGINYNLQKYDIPTNTWTINSGGQFTYNDNNIACALDVKRGILAFWNGAASGAPTYQVVFYQTNNGLSSTAWLPSTTGTAPTAGTGFGSIIYDEMNDYFVIWNNTGKTFYTLTAPATNPYSGGNSWTWATVTPSSGSTPTTEQANGTFGRFAYISNPNIPGYALLNDVTQSIYFYRP